MKEVKEKTKKKVSEIVETLCSDKNCHKHGNLKVRGRVFEGKIIRKFQKRVTIEFERMIYVRKYERYKKSKTKIHARLPDCMKDEFNLEDHIRIQECRPLSKIVHFVVIGKVRQKAKPLASSSKSQTKEESK